MSLHSFRSSPHWSIKYSEYSTKQERTRNLFEAFIEGGRWGSGKTVMGRAGGYSETEAKNLSTTPSLETAMAKSAEMVSITSVFRNTSFFPRSVPSRRLYPPVFAVSACTLTSFRARSVILSWKYVIICSWSRINLTKGSIFRRKKRDFFFPRNFTYENNNFEFHILIFNSDSI